MALPLLTGAACQRADGDVPPPAVNVVDTVRLTFDYQGVTALVEAIGQDSLTDADIDALLRVHGVRAMVDNVSRFIPGIGEAEFRDEIKHVARTKRGGDADQYFRLRQVWTSRDRMRELMTALRNGEADIQREVIARLAPYQPRSGDLEVTAYFVAGGVSTGFVPDNANVPAFYANIVRERRVEDVLGNAVHETYHVMQKAAQRHAPSLVAVADSVEQLPLAVRLIATTLAEGTAMYVTDGGRGRRVSSGRSRQNFAVFDTVLAGLRGGTLSWQQAYGRGFTSDEDERFYEMGQEMTRAIVRYCGHSCVRQLFHVAPIEFFRQYIRLYREHPEIVGRFAPGTERFLETPETG